MQILRVATLLSVAGLTSGLAYGSTPILITGDSWSNMGDGSQTFYDDFLVENTEIDILDNVGVGGRGIWFATWSGNQAPLLDYLDNDLAENPSAEAVVIATGGSNDFLHLFWTSTEFELSDFQDAVRDISTTIAATGARPIWGNAPLVPGMSGLSGWTENESQMVFDYNSWLLNFCMEKGYTCIDLHSEFIQENGEFETDPITEETYAVWDQVHLSPAGAEHLADLVGDAVAIAVQDLPTLSLTASNFPVPTFTVDEGQVFDIEVVRNGNDAGTAQVYAGVYYTYAAPGQNAGTASWGNEDHGVKTVSITAATFASDTETDILLGWPSGSTTTPGVGIGVATLKINSIPVVTINSIAPDWYWAPALSGTVDDPTADIEITVNSNSYEATNNGDGTWTLPANTLAPATPNTYTVTVVATDGSGDSDDATTNQVIVW